MVDIYSAMKRILHYTQDNVQDIPINYVSYRFLDILDISNSIIIEKEKNNVSDVLELTNVSSMILFKGLTKFALDKIYELFIYQHMNKDSIDSSLYYSFFILIEHILKADLVSEKFLSENKTSSFNIYNENINLSLSNCNVCKQLTTLFVKEMKSRHEENCFKEEYDLLTLDIYNKFIEYMNNNHRKI